MGDEARLDRLIAALERLNALLAEQPQTAENPAAQILLSLVPLTGVIFGCVLLFFFFLWQYRIRKELIRAGQYTPMFTANIRTLSLLIGLLGVMVGAPMTLLFVLIEGLSYVLLGGLLPIFAGLGFLLFYLLTVQKKDG